MGNSKPLLGALALAACSGAFAAADDVKVCDAVPARDIESALAIKVARMQPGIHECTWVSPDPTVFAQVGVMKRYAHKVSGTEAMEQMKTLGYKGAILDDTPELWCAKLTAPSNMSGAEMISCNALTKGHYFEVKAVGPKMTREKAKALVGSLAARFP